MEKDRTTDSHSTDPNSEKLEQSGQRITTIIEMNQYFDQEIRGGRSAGISVVVPDEINPSPQDAGKRLWSIIQQRHPDGHLVLWNATPYGNMMRIRTDDDVEKWKVRIHPRQQ